MANTPSEKIQVLDQGFVRLLDWMGDDLSIVRAARASFDAHWRAGLDEGSDAKLIKYLYTHGHNTPIEAVEFQFEVYAPIFVFRQWHRHRTWTYNELSARYKELPSVWYTPPVFDIGFQSTNNKQASDFRDPTPQELEQRMEDLRLYDTTMDSQYMTYQRLLKNGWPRERARGVLGTAFYSHMFAKVDLHNLFGFLLERDDDGAQMEIRQYARAITVLLKARVPVAFREYIRGRILQRRIQDAINMDNTGYFNVTEEEVTEEAVRYHAL